MASDSRLNLAGITLGAWQARLIERSANILAHFVECTQEDKLRWRPATDENSQTRSVMEQLGECIFANQRFLCYLRDETPPAMPDNFDSYGGVPEATAALRTSALELATHVRGMMLGDLERMYQTHRGPMPGALAVQFPVRNMTYHMGQINMIQLLYGDKEFHIDDEFTAF